MANKISVVIDVAVDKANRGIKSFQKSVKDADGAVGKFKAGSKSAFNSLQANAGAAALAIGGSLLAIGTKAVQAASTLEESINAVNKTFGDAAEGVLEIGKSADTAMGLSQSAFNSAAVSFSSFAKQVAGPGGDVAAVIGDLTTRASDFASVMNLDVSEAANVFRSGLSGETESLKRFGIDLSAASVEAHALATGLVASKSEMTEAIKVQARYSLLMELTNDVAGDFADTSDGLANGTRILAAQWENASATLGQRLIPVVEQGVAVLNDFGSAADNAGVDTEKWADRATTAWTASIGGVGLFATAFMKANDAIRGDSDDTADEIEAAADRHAAAHIKNQRGIENYQRQVSQDAHVKAYKEHTAGMIAESERMADEMAADVQRIEDKYQEFYDEIASDNALLDLEEGWEDMAEAGQAAWDKAIAGADDAEQASRDYQREINGQKNRVLDFIGTLEDVPPETTSELLALVDEGKAREAERRLNAIAAGRTVAFRAQVFGAEVARDQLNRTGRPVMGATGGIVTKPTLATIGEAGPEAVIPLNKTPGSSPLPSGGLGGNSYSITVNALDPQSASRAVIEAIKVHERRNGPGWRQ